MGERLRGLLGYLLILLICYLLSSNRRAIRWRPVLWGLALQAAFGLIVLHPVLTQLFFRAADAGVGKLLGFAGEGIRFVFGATQPHQLIVLEGAQSVTRDILPGQISPVLKTFAFWVLPTVIFFSSLVTLLYHLRIMQWVVGGIARAMVHMLGTSGAETLNAAANIVLGQTEAPLFIRPFIPRLTQSEMMAVMLAGFGTVSAGIMAVYVSFLHELPGIAGHLITASIMAAPASLALSKILLPETERPETAGVLHVAVDRPDRNAIEATARGATEGMTLVLNIAAVLIAFVAVVAMVNALLGLAHTSLEQLLGWLLSPLAWAMGVRWAEAGLVGRLVGEKLVLTELLAYSHLGAALVPGMGGALTTAPLPPGGVNPLGPPGRAVLGLRGAVIAAYSLCGFANVASIGIQIGGIGGMAPARRGDLARLGMRAMIGGALVSCLSACIAGLMVR